MGVRYRLTGSMNKARENVASANGTGHTSRWTDVPDAKQGLTMPAFRHGASALNVLATSRERAWRAPSGKRANGKPNTYLRTALAAGLDRSALLTGESENVHRGKYSHIRIDGPDAGLTLDGRGRRFA